MMGEGGFTDANNVERAAWNLGVPAQNICCENRVLRRIFGPKRDDVMRDWRKLHNEELHNL
jgi:hypothetical protein